MEVTTKRIERLDLTFRTWFKKHVKWIKGIVCYVDGGVCITESGEIVTLVYVIAETYDKKNPHVIYGTYWSGNEIVGHCKSSLADINKGFYINNIIVPPCDSARMMKMICSLILTESLPIEITINDKSEE